MEGDVLNAMRVQVCVSLEEFDESGVKPRIVHSINRLQLILASLPFPNVRRPANSQVGKQECLIQEMSVYIYIKPVAVHEAPQVGV